MIHTSQLVLATEYSHQAKYPQFDMKLTRECTIHVVLKESKLQTSIQILQ